MRTLVSRGPGRDLSKATLLICCLFFPYACSLDEQLMTALLKGVSIRKCSCKANEYFVDGRCLQGNTTIPMIFSTDYVEPMWEPTAIFDDVLVQELDCPVESVSVSIQAVDLFVMALTGDIYHVSTNSTFTKSEYCFEHILNETESLTWEVKLCLQSPTIQVCCSEQNLTQKACEPSHLPVFYGYSLLKNPEVDFVRRPMRCSDKEVEKTVQVQEPLSFSYISYESASAVLIDYSGISKGLGAKYLPADHYCVLPKDRAMVEASFCIPDPLISHLKTCGEKKTCVRKCCPEGMLYSTGEQSCIPYGPKMLWKPRFRTKNGSKIDAPSKMHIISGFPICKRHFYSLSPSQDQEQLYLLPTGELYTNSTGPVQSWKYCLENFLNPSNNIQETALLCFPEEEQQMSSCSRVKEFLYPILLIFSCIFLAITLLVYALIPELHAKLHGKSLLSHVTALMTAYLFLAIVQWGSRHLSMVLCRSFALALQVSFLAAFFWLNVMCFDIWWALRSMRPVAETSSTSRRRFFYYSVYAWGCPLVIGAVTLAMELLLPLEEYSNFILPGFGRTKCWFQENLSLWAYFYGFVSVLTISNIIFFIFVAVILLRAHRSNHDILKLTRQHHKERIWIYLKLFVVMGITWLCEILSWQEGSCEYWLFTDIINALQGFFIFLIFICKRNVWEKLRGKWNKHKKRKPGSSASDGSSSRSTLQSTLESSTMRKLSTLHYHLSRFQRDTIKDGIKEEPKQN